MPREVVEIPTDSPDPIEWVSKRDADGRFVLGVIIGVAVGMLVCGAIIFLVPC